MSLDYYKRQMVDLRARMAREREAKKKDNAYYAERIKNESTASGKASYRKSKIDKAAYHDRAIESLKHSIEMCKENIARARKSR